MARYLPTGERLQNKVSQAWCPCHIKLCKIFCSTEGITSPQCWCPKTFPDSVSCTLGQVNKHMVKFWWKAATNKSPAKWTGEPLLLGRPVCSSSYVVLCRIFRYFVAEPEWFVLLCAWMGVCPSLSIPHNVCVEIRLTALTQVLKIGLRLPDLCGKCLNCLSHLTSPKFRFYIGAGTWSTSFTASD